MTTEMELDYLYSNTTALDAPDERDFIYEELLGSSGSDLPDEILPDKKTPVLNQGKTSRCTLFSCAWAATEQNYWQAKSIGVDEYPKLNGNEYVEDAIKLGFSEENGWYIQSAVRLYQDKWAFEGYAKITTDEGVCRAIYEKKPLCTWSNQIDWKLSRPWIAVFKIGSPWHAFFIVWYDKEYFYMKNSWGEAWWDKGYFKVARKEFARLFTCYAILDKSDAPLLYGYYAKKKGWCVLEDFRWEDKCTREFAAELISKATGKLKESFWDWKIPTLILTESKFKKMADGAWVKYDTVGVNVLKRWEVVKALRFWLK